MKTLFTFVSRAAIILAILTISLKSYSQGTQIARAYGTTTAGAGFLEYLPPDYNIDPNRKFPTIIFLHGIGEAGNGSVTDLAKVAVNGPPMLIKAGKWPVKSPATGLYPAETFIVISPQNANGFFNPDVLKKFIDWVVANYRVDPDRVHLTGLSAGGISCWNYLNKYNHQLASVIPICGNGNSVAANACFFKNIPMWAFHGDADPTVNVGGSINPVKKLNLCVPPPVPLAKVTTYPGVGHNSWARTYDLTGMKPGQTNPLYSPYDISIYDWMLQFRRGAVPSPLPIANAGPDINLSLPTTSVNITGTGSTTIGSITSYVWTNVSGSPFVLTNASTPTVTISGLAVGVYTFRLTVTNTAGDVAYDDVKITVLNVNQAPTANAGADVQITLPTNSLNLPGSGTDTDGSIASYLWSQVSGTSTLTLGASKTTATLSLSSLPQGTYTFALTVTDNLGATGSDQITVTVNPAVVNQLPTANAGPDKIINLPTSSTTLPGSGSDPDGSITTYLWSKVNGPATFTLANQNTATASLSNLVAGIYTFKLTVTDNAGATASDQVIVTVVAANQSPIANAGSDITITLPTSVTNITGSGSDPDGTVTGYSWTFVSGPTPLPSPAPSIANATATTMTLSNLTLAGTYTVRLTVTDDKGATGFDDVKIIVNAAPVNVPPTANAGVDKSITLPINTITLNGSGTDSDGSIASYEWQVITAPLTLTSGDFPSGLNSASLVVTNMNAPGAYTFKFIVTDNQGATASDNVTVNVQPAVVNQVPVANAGSDVVLTLPTNSVNLNGSGTDADGTIASYSWTKTSGPVPATEILTGASTTTLQLASLSAGVYVFQLTVTDDKGATNSDDVTVTINNANVPPTANAGLDITLNLPTSLTDITGTANDVDGSITSTVWSLVSKPAGSSPVLGSNSSTLTVSVSNLVVAGTYTYRLTVTDDDGDTGTDDVKVIVNAANLTPTANAGTDKVITLPTNSANFAGTGTDPDGTIASYLWTNTSAPIGATVTLTNDNTKTLTVSVDKDGVYTFRLVVTDNNGASDFDDVLLTVNQAAVNQPPIANAGQNQSITLPINSLTISGTGSDPDGSIASYTWTKISGPATFSLVNGSSSTVSIETLGEGTYTFRLTVTDNLGLTSSDDVVVTVLPAAVNQSPTANAGTDKSITLPINSITIFGSGSDPDGTIVSYNWTQLNLPSVTLSNATTPNLSLSSLAAGTYTFRLTVTDDKGATGTDDVTLTVNAVAVNQPPVANAGTDKVVILPTTSLNLIGSGNDADGSITSYAWLKVSGSSTVNLGPPTDQSTLSLSNLIEGTYVFRLEVTDNSGATDTDDVTVTVLPSTTNQIPVVSAGSDKTITLPTNTVALLGSGSDADGSITFQWTQVAGEVTLRVLLNETTPFLTVNNLQEGTYKFRLTVTDDKLATAYDEVTVVVNPIGVNQPPVANAGTDATIKLPTNTIILNGSGTDIDGTISSYAWLKISGPGIIMPVPSNTAAITLNNLTEGVYEFELTVTDNSGATSTDNVIVTVLPASINVPPSANAGDDLFLQLPTTSITITGTSSDDGTNPLAFIWTQVSGPTLANSDLSGTASQTLSVSNLKDGVYVFRFKVTDDGGLSDFDEMTLTVSPEPASAPPPTVDAGADVTLQLPVNDLVVTAVADSPTGLIVSYKWTQIVGGSVTIDPDTSNILSIQNLTPGNYSFKITVMDANGISAEDEVNVLVLEEEPVAKPVNLFSPDGRGDPSTETWAIKNSMLLDGCEVVVYNRQGQKVYSSIGYPTEWNGTYNGNPLPDGAYFYVISCSGQKSQTGSVTIARLK